MPKPKLLLDENIGGAVFRGLRDYGYDVVSILETSPGKADGEVLAQAYREKRIVVTLDRDFGSLIFRDSKRHVGVLFLRLTRETPEAILKIILKVLDHYGGALIGRFAVASESNIRMRSAVAKFTIHYDNDK